MGQVEAPPAGQLPSRSFSAAAPGSCTSRRCWAHFCPHPLSPLAGSLLRITVSIPPRPLFEHQTHLTLPLVVSWPREWPKLIRLDLNTPVFLLKSAHARFCQFHFQNPSEVLYLSPSVPAPRVQPPACRPTTRVVSRSFCLDPPHSSPSSSCSQHLLQRPSGSHCPLLRNVQGTPVAPTVSSVSHFPERPSLTPGVCSHTIPSFPLEHLSQ